MTREEFSEAVAIARSGECLIDCDDSVLFGYGLPDFEPVVVTIEVAAKAIRWQCVLLNGEVDIVELNSVFDSFKRKVLIV